MATTQTLTTLLLKNNGTRTIANVSPVPNTENNLADWFIKLEITNTGVSKTNNGTLTLRIDELGTFIRTGPILVNEDTKNTYLIELQLQQDLDNDGDFLDSNEKSIVLRAIIGQPQISIDETFGEILRISLTGIEYNMKEISVSTWHLFQNPNESFGNRITELSGRFSDIGTITLTNNLPTSPVLSFKPTGPVTLHSRLTEIIDILSLPQVTGGSFDDFYFDVEPDETFTTDLTMIAEKFGNTDSGVTIDPLSVNVFDASEEQTVVTDNIEYKNNVILVGTANGGSMPMERTRFASRFEHAKIRDEWSPASVSYIKGDLVKLVTSTTFKPHLTTFHIALVDHTSTASTPITTSGTLWEQDFTTYPNFITTSGTFYKAGEIVTVTGGGLVNFFQCNRSDTYPTGLDLSLSVDWNPIITVNDSDYTAFVTYSPWTNDVDLWKDTLAGTSNAPAGTEGWAFDWNVTKSNYNRKDFNNHFETITPKVVQSIETTQPIATNINNYDTQRYLLSSSPTGTDWSGNGNKVAEQDGGGVLGTWKFSEAPVDSDIVNILDLAQIHQYDGANWGVIWDGTDVDDTDKPSPFHLCENVGLIAGATGISGQAVEFKYNWAITAPTHYFRTSRGLWISQSFPLPRIGTANFVVGELFGGRGGSDLPSEGTLDTNNYDTNHEGVAGWNQGILDEDYGRISAMSFKMRVSMFRNAAGTSLVEGQPDVPMTFWAIDKFDRVWFSNFKLRRNGQWDSVRISIGDLAQNQLYYARWDELARLANGIVLTQLDFTISEKEFSGVQFDWRDMKHWGVQLSEAYVEVGLYKHGLDRAFDYIEDVGADLQANWWWFLGGPAAVAVKNSLPQHTPVTQNHVRLSAKIAIDDLHFEKEQIATSDDSPLSNARTSIEHLSTENDYVNLKDRAVAFQARKRFFPQIWHIRATGDVRLRFGQQFTVTGSRYPEQVANNSAWLIGTAYDAGDKVSFGGFVWQAKRATTGDQPDISDDDWENLNKMVVAEVKHIYDHDGYHAEIAGFRKFVVSG